MTRMFTTAARLWALCLILGFATTAMAQSTLWERNARTDAAAIRPTWFGAGTERGIAYGMNGTTPVIYVASRNGGNSIKMVNADTGADITDGPVFDLTSVAGGTFVIQDINVTSDGKIVLTNMTSDARTSAFKVYVFEPTGGAPITTHSYLSTEVAGTATVRLGDKVTVTGSWSAGTITVWATASFASPAPGILVKLSTTNQGTAWTSAVTTLSAAATGDALIVANSGVTPVTGGFMINGNGSLVRRYNDAGAFQVGQTAGYTSSNTGVKSFTSGSRELIAVYTYRPATMTAGDVTGYVAVWDITNPMLPTFVGRSTSMSTATAANAVNGDLEVRVNSDGSYILYGLATDQGLIAYSMPMASAPQFIAYWDTQGLSGITESPLLPTSTASNLSSGGLVRGSGLLATSLANGFASSGWTSVSPSAAATAGHFYEFNLSVEPGFQYDVDGLGFLFRRTGTGPNKLQLFYSLNGGSFIALNDSISYTGTEDGFPFGPFDLSGVADLKNLDHTDNLVIRLSGWGASATTGTGAIGRQAGPDLHVLGSVEVNPNYVPPTNYTAMLSGVQENPPVFSMGTGSVLASLDGDTLRVSGQFSGLTGDYTMSHIHVGANGTNGGVVFTLSAAVAEGLKGGTYAATANKFFMTATQKEALAAGSWYVNIHSSTSPSGEIRGQLYASGNTAPTAAAITAPVDASSLTLSGLRISPFTATWSASTDAENHAVTYIWQLSATPDFSSVLVNTKVATPSFSTTFAVVDQILADAGVQAGGTATVYHRVIATDGSGSSTSATASVVLTRGDLVDVLSIAEARALPVGSTIVVEGVVSRVKGNFLYFQDATAGLAIRQTAGTFFTAMGAGTIKAGTRIKVTGKTSEFRFLLQINQTSATVNDLAAFEILGNEALPAAQLVTLADLEANGESFESELVYVQSATITFGADLNFVAARNYAIADASKPTGSAVVLRIPNAADSDVDGLPTINAPYNVETVVGQFSTTESNIGYQLLAIAATDVAPVPQPALAGVYSIPSSSASGGFEKLSDAVRYLNVFGSTGPVVFSITESIVDTVTAVRIDRQDLTDEKPLIIAAADGATPVVKLRQLINFASSHVYILGSAGLISEFDDEETLKALRKAIPSKEEGIDGFSEFEGFLAEWGPRSLTFEAATSLGSTPFFLWEGAVTDSYLSGIKLTMTGTLGAGAPGIRINRRDAVGVGQGGADNVVLANVQIGASEDVGKFQTAINVWGSSSGVFPAKNVYVVGSEIHANHRGISTQVFADAAFMNNEIYIYGNAGQAVHAGIEINTPVGQLTVFGNEIKKLQSVRTAATTMIGIQLTNSLNDNGIFLVNNMVAANYSNTNAGVTNHNVYGIAHTGSGTVADINVYNNTVEINATGQTTGVTAGLIQTTGSSASPFYAYNNIFVNRTEGGFGASWSGPNLLSDWNNYFATTLKRVGTDNYTTVETLRASGRDMKSVSTDVQFVSATNLRLAGASLSDATLTTEPGSSFATDIDGNPRSVFAPYIGAHEGAPVPVVATGFELLTPDSGANVSLLAESTDLISITWEQSYSTEAWGAKSIEFLNDAYAHAGNGQSGQGKYVGTLLNSEATLTTPVLQNVGDLSFYIATYNNQTVLSVLVEASTDGETWSLVDTYNAVSGGTGNINFDWQKKTISLDAAAAMVRFRVVGAANIAGAVYFDDFTKTTVVNDSEVSVVESFEDWTGLVTLRYTWHLDSPQGNFSAPVLSIPSDDNGQTPSLTLTHAELDQAIASLNKGWGETYTGRWTVTASVGNVTMFADEPHAISIRRIVNTSIDETDAPLTFALEQNYPNPFNPSTSIKFSLPETANVTLHVYSITGQLVATLVNEVKPAGVYNVSFDASTLASGVYIYRINAGGFTDTQKMTLIK